MANPRPNPLTILASTLDQLMGSRGLTLVSLAAKTRIDVGRLGAILDGREEATAEDLLRLAGAFGVEPGELLAGVTWIPDEQGGGRFLYRAPGPVD